ncbi:hypothetical protein U14_00670 [Candidatus Moduliflexus flocculans]|uniref:Uncharacterized protein n=1 Tax=Candidatus Moduliflexus flocculans TaxID=1499966 RepID=A0A0S6VQF2_9BACT|nr:hypothetical protein U14_00670 [Candidatus Moduliflexus flocculans]
MKMLSFSHVTFADLQKLVNIRQVVNDAAFGDWFGYAYPLNPTERQLLAALVEEHRPFMLSYSEDELKMKFLAPLLNAVHFHENGIRDWYQRPLKATINQVTLNGYVDFMVAKGVEEPEYPYFFIQEFKKTKIEQDPKNQLLAEMLVAIETNQTNIMRGAFIIGQHWQFMMLVKTFSNTYEYMVSKSFDSAWLEELLQIYTNLQAVKALFCHE